MNNKRFDVLFCVLLILQLFLTKYCQAGPFVCISLLPAMVFCIPTSRYGWQVMLTAFISGVLVDIFADGPVGLNASALIPVGVLQKLLISKIIDDDIVERHYSFSFYENGFPKISTALLIEYGVFFSFYVLLDSAGTRSPGFNLLHIVCSTFVSLIFGLCVVNVLCPHSKK